VCEDYGAIECAVYAIGGWADAYRNAVLRLMANLTCPKKGLIGPWSHAFPHDAVPGPEIGYLQEAVRWWDHWLKGRRTGIMDEPALRFWMQESVPPLAQYAERPGRWVAEEIWPSPRIRPLRLALNTGHLAEKAEPSCELSFCSPQSTGIHGGEWCAFGADGEMPRDQRPDDGGSLVFESDPLLERIEILGAPVLSLELRADRPVAHLAARLCDVAPDGSVLRVTYGLLNLCHRQSHERPQALVPGRWERVRVPLNDIAHVYPAGHRVRVSLSTSYWPIAWPSPEPAVLGIRTGASTVDLPVRPASQHDARLPAFAPPMAADVPARMGPRRPPLKRKIEIDLATNETIFTLAREGEEIGEAPLTCLEDIDLGLGYAGRRRYRIVETDPLSAETELEQSARLVRGDWSVRLDIHTRLTATKETFEFQSEVEASLSDEPLATRSWKLSIPRALL